LANSIDHPDVVKVHECEIDDGGCPYLVMELLEGESLQQVLDRERRLPAERVEAFGTQLLDIIAAAHEKHILHRDLKPSNIFVTTQGTLKVLDFGLARGLATRETLAHVSTVTGSLTLLGTPGYMAPEVARGRTESVDARTDVWAIGATLFTLLAGRTVHEAETVNELLGRAMSSSAPAIASVVPDVPNNLARAIDRALSYEMGDRYPGVREMRRDLTDQDRSDLGARKATRAAVTSLDDVG
jgi:serine/threonine-protein kinase